MPANTQVTAALVMNNVPADLECKTANITEIGTALVQVLGIQAENPEAPTSQTDSTAALALNTANNAIAQVNILAGQIPQSRTSGSPYAVPNGDSTQSLSWAPDMPSTNYEVRVTIYGTDTAAGQFYGYRVVENTRALNSCQVRLDNMPAGSKIAWVVEEI